MAATFGGGGAADGSTFGAAAGGPLDAAARGEERGWDVRCRVGVTRSTDIARSSRGPDDDLGAAGISSPKAPR